MMSPAQEFITIALMAAGTMITRFLPFIIFGDKRETPAFVRYLGQALPPAIFGMLIIYCLRHVSLLSGNHGLPEFLAILVTVVLHLWKRRMLLSIAGGTISYMLLIQFLF